MKLMTTIVRPERLAYFGGGIASLGAVALSRSVIVSAHPEEGPERLAKP